jgi:hypothetical protein
MINQRDPAAQEHPSKRMRMDPDPSAPPPPPFLQSHGQRPSDAVAQQQQGPPQQQQKPPALLPSMGPQYGKQPPPSRAPETPTEVKEVKKEGGADWMTLYNPKVKRTLDVELVHTLIHDRSVRLLLQRRGLTRGTAWSAASSFRRMESCWRRAATAIPSSTTRRRAPSIGAEQAVSAMRC